MVITFTNAILGRGNVWKYTRYMYDIWKLKLLILCYPSSKYRNVVAYTAPSIVDLPHQDWKRWRNVSPLHLSMPRWYLTFTRYYKRKVDRCQNLATRADMHFQLIRCGRTWGHGVNVTPFACSGYELLPLSYSGEYKAKS